MRGSKPSTVKPIEVVKEEALAVGEGPTIVEVGMRLVIFCAALRLHSSESIGMKAAMVLL